MLPEAVPDAGGANVTVKVAFCPAISASGKVMPLTEYPLPVQLAEDMVTAEPVAVSVPVRVVLLPTATVPKLIVGTETTSEPAVVVPLPLGLVFSEVVPPPQPTNAAATSTTNAWQYRHVAIYLRLSPERDKSV